MKKRTWQIAILAGLVAAAISFNASAHNKNYNNTVTSKTGYINQEVSILSEKAPTLDPKILKLALTAYVNAHSMGMDPKQILSVINYHMADGEKRLWVFDLKANRLLYNTYVAQGKASGLVYGTHFSNSPETHSSSVGLYLTENTYFGKNGYSLRLNGLDNGFNNNALARDIVMHGAWYVSPVFAQSYGRIGNSWGCPSVPKSMAEPIINTVKNGTLIFAYAPVYSWLHESKFLNVA